MPLATAQQSIGTADARLHLLDDYLEDLATRYATLEPGDIVEFEQGAIQVSPWVAAAIVQFARFQSPEEPTLERTVAQSVALMVKCKVDLGSCRGLDPCSELFRAQAELMLNVAVGTALVRRLQRHSDEVLASGDVQKARPVNKLQHQVRNAVQKARQGIGDSERSRAAEIADIIQPTSGSPADDGGEIPDFEVPVVILADQQQRWSAPPPSPKTSILRANVFRIRRTPGHQGPPRWMVATLLIVMGLGIWGAINHEPPVEPYAAVPPSKVWHLDDIAGVERVQDRPPYVVLTVEVDFWRERDETARLTWLRSLSRRAQTAGYRGLVVRDAPGKPLAEWIRGKPPRLDPTRVETSSQQAPSS